MSATAITAAFLAAHPLPVHDSAGDKTARGHVMVVGGSVEVPGAALLAGIAALRAGAGVLRVVTGRSSAMPLAVALPEARVIGVAETAAGGIDPAAATAVGEHAAECEAVLIGPGMTDHGAAGALAGAVLAGADGPRFVVDAAALTGLGGRAEALARQAGRVVITPHAGEMAHFLGVDRDAVLADPLAAARQVAGSAQCVVVMKGACTYVVSPSGAAWSCEEGTIGLATSGSGDVLAGVIAGLLARGAVPLLAAQWGVYLHARAGARLAETVGPVGFLARELPPEITRVMAET